MAGRWQHTPEWAYRHPQTMRMPLDVRAVYLSLWLYCDRWGRGDADEWALRSALCIVDGTEVVPLLERISPELLTMYEVSGRRYWQLVDHGRDGPRDATKNRSPSTIPPPTDVSGRVQTNPNTSPPAQTSLDVSGPVQPEQVAGSREQGAGSSSSCVCVSPGDLRAGEGAGAHEAPPDTAADAADTHTPLSPVAPWPDDRCARAASRWLVQLGRRRKRPPPDWTAELAELAGADPDAFLRGAEAMLGAAKGWSGRGRAPLEWLVVAVAIARERRDEAEARRAKKRGPSPPREAPPPPPVWQAEVDAVEHLVDRALASAGRQRETYAAMAREALGGLSVPPEVRGPLEQLVTAVSLPPADEVWRRVRAQLQGTLTAYDLLQWVDPLRAVGLDGEVLVLGAPDASHVSLVEERGWLAGLEVRWLEGVSA